MKAIKEKLYIIKEHHLIFLFIKALLYLFDFHFKYLIRFFNLLYHFFIFQSYFHCLTPFYLYYLVFYRKNLKNLMGTFLSSLLTFNDLLNQFLYFFFFIFSNLY